LFAAHELEGFRRYPEAFEVSLTYLRVETLTKFSWKGAIMIRLLRSSGFSLVPKTLLVVVPLLAASLAFAQTQRPKPMNGGGNEPDPVFQEYRGVQIGWLADDVRKKLGSPANKGDELDIFAFGEKESAQIYYDKASRKVTAISVDFMSGATEIITPQQVFGADIQANADGSKNKLVRYPKLGYWISYNRTAGDSPMVSITIQKMAPQ
jgi:hypothetical protein